MSDKRANLEMIAPSVEEAIAKGLNELGLSQEHIEIEVLDEGSRGGLFGLGARQARVRLTVKVETPSTPTPIPAPTPAPQVALSVEPEKTVELDAPANEASDQPQDELLEAASATVQTLLQHMQISAQISARYEEIEDGHGKPQVWVDVHGTDLNVLVGRKAETLNALQYITSLILSKQMGRTVNVIVDVEKYRERRVQQIRQLASRLADQAVKTGRCQALEPMPSNERRIIHMALRDNPDVRTESAGEEPYRKVVIIPVD